jgi:catechol-2,3-dioxygenase
MEEQMKFCGGLFAVRDLERSKAFYKKYLNQDVIIDYGANVTLTGGFSLQTLPRPGAPLSAASMFVSGATTRNCTLKLMIMTAS